MNDREEFEAWALAERYSPCDLSKSDGFYVDPVICQVYAAWQADRRWRPIETAPKGKLLLLFEPEVKRNSRPEAGLKARIVVESWPTHYPRKATHWMPLPDPPETP